MAEANEAGRSPVRTSIFLQHIAPVLMQKLIKQEDSDDELERNPSKAASICLMLLSRFCEDDIDPHVLPFIHSNIKSGNWRFREAALKAFGSILGSVSSDTSKPNLKPLVEEAMPTLIQAMYDSNVAVRDTAAWNLGRICAIFPETVINNTYLKPLLESLISGLKDEPRVAANVCWAFTGLAEAAYDAYVDVHCIGSQQPKTYCMSTYFDHIVERLLETTDRQDAAQHNLRSAAYTALVEMVEKSPTDCYVTVQKTTMVILERLQQVLQMENHISSQADRSELIDLLCDTLLSVLRKITPEDAHQISDSIMTALVTMFAKNLFQKDDALMTVSTLFKVLGEGFLIKLVLKITENI